MREREEEVDWEEDNWTSGNYFKLYCSFHFSFYILHLHAPKNCVFIHLLSFARMMLTK